MPESMTASGRSFVCALPGSHRVGCSAALALIPASTAINSGLPIPPGGAHSLRYGHQITRDHLWRLRPAAAERAAEARKAADRLACEAWNKPHASLPRACPALAPLGRRPQRRLSLSRSKMPRLQHASNRRARHRSPAEDHANPRIGAIHALQRLLRGSQLSV